MPQSFLGNLQAAERGSYEGRNPGSLSLTSSVLMSAAELYCFSGENWGPAQEHEQKHRDALHSA